MPAWNTPAEVHEKISQQLKVQLEMQRLSRGRRERAALIKGLIRAVCRTSLKRGNETGLLISIALVPKQNKLISTLTVLFIREK